MQKYQSLFIVSLLLMICIAPISIAYASMEKKYISNDPAITPDSITLYGNHWAGQTFKPSQGFKLTKVSLSLQILGDNVTLVTIGIAYEQNKTNFLAKVDISGSSISHSGYQKYNFTFPEITLHKDNTYCLIIHTNGGGTNSSSDCLGIQMFTSDTYSNGKLITSDNNGQTWSELGSGMWDMWVILYGYPDPVETMYQTVLQIIPLIVSIAMIGVAFAMLKQMRI